MTSRRVGPTYAPGSILTPEEITGYCLRYRARNAFGVLDEKEIKQTISYAADYWRLEKISITEFGRVADPAYPNRSMKAHPIVHYFNTSGGKPYCEVLDGLHRIGMARASRKRKLLAWVGHLETGQEEVRRPRPPIPRVALVEARRRGRTRVVSGQRPPPL